MAPLTEPALVDEFPLCGFQVHEVELSAIGRDSCFFPAPAGCQIPDMSLGRSAGFLHLFLEIRIMDLQLLIAGLVRNTQDLPALRQKTAEFVPDPLRDTELTGSARPVRKGKELAPDGEETVLSVVGHVGPFRVFPRADKIGFFRLQR